MRKKEKGVRKNLENLRNFLVTSNSNFEMFDVPLEMAV